MESGGEGGELRRGCAPLLLGQGGRGGVGRRLVVAASMPTILALKEKGGGVVGRGGDSVGEAGWSARLPWRRKVGDGEAGMAACGGARLRWRLSPA
jgi:hypothetical protein